MTKRWFNWLFKVSVTLLLAGALYWHIGSRQHLEELWGMFVGQMQGANLGWLIATVALMPLNWWAETQKWYPFVLRHEPISQWRAFRAVLAGVSFALFTPHRIGEYGGRVLFLRSANHWRAILANLVGSVSQLLVLLTGGAFGSAYFLYRFLHIPLLYIGAGLLLSLSGLGVAYFFYFNIRTGLAIARRMPWLRRFEKFGRAFQGLLHFSRAELAYILRWSALRYAIYSTQYFLLLRFFGLPVDLAGGYAGIVTLFLMQTSIPLPAMTSLVARGNFAVFVWGFFGANEISSLAATFVLWIINLILPALFGTFSLLYVNITKSFGYEDDIRTDSGIVPQPEPVASLEHPG